MDFTLSAGIIVANSCVDLWILQTSMRVASLRPRTCLQKQAGEFDKQKGEPKWLTKQSVLAVRPCD